MSFVCNKLKVELEDKVLLDISFEIEDSLALVGASGSGKSLTLKSFLNLLPSSMKIEFDYDSEFEIIAGDTVSFIPQNPFTALSPLTKIKDQFFVEKSRQIELMKQVGLGEEFLNRFPPELSGGQLQRVVIAFALSKSPKLLLLDEPTTALDNDTTNNILELIKTLQKEMGFLMLFVTHELEAVKKVCNRIVVLLDGKVVEFGELDEVVSSPKEQYTKQLIDAGFEGRSFRE